MRSDIAKALKVSNTAEQSRNGMQFLREVIGIPIPAITPSPITTPTRKRSDAIPKELMIYNSDAVDDMLAFGG